MLVDGPGERSHPLFRRSARPSPPGGTDSSPSRRFPLVPTERRSYDADIAVIKTHIEWIRQTLEDADLVSRVGNLEQAQARTKGALAAVTGSILLLASLAGVAKAAGILH